MRAGSARSDSAAVALAVGHARDADADDDSSAVDQVEVLGTNGDVDDDHEPSEYPSDMNVAVRFTHPIVGDGISVSTIQGFRPGDDLRAFAADLGEEWHGGEYESFPAETGPDVGERGYDEWNDTYWEYANAYAVDVSQVYVPEPGVTSVVSAPWNFGIGHV